MLRHVNADLIKARRLCCKPRCYPLHNGRYRAVQRANIRYNAIIYGFHGLLCCKRSRASHCSLHVCGNGIHAAAEALANARGHIAANVSKNR